MNSRITDYYRFAENAFETFTRRYIIPMHAELFVLLASCPLVLTEFYVFRGKMMASDLDQKIEKAKAEGAKPFFVGAMAGTTVLGAFDSLNEIADVCEKHKLWLHVD